MQNSEFCFLYHSKIYIKKKYSQKFEVYSIISLGDIDI